MKCKETNHEQWRVTETVHNRLPDGPPAGHFTSCFPLNFAHHFFILMPQRLLAALKALLIFLVDLSVGLVLLRELIYRMRNFRIHSVLVTFPDAVVIYIYPLMIWILTVMN